MRLHLLEIYREPESGVRTPSIFPIIGSHLKSLFSSWRAITWNQATANLGCVGWLEFQGLEWDKWSLCGWMCERMNRESYSRNIAGSRVWTAPMELEYGNVGSLLKAEGDCLGGCDDICSSLWPLCGAKYINAVNSDTHTPLIHMMKLFPAHRYTLVESAHFFFL